MRALATIRRITVIEPIPGADAIECAWVNGWSVVVKKGEFKVGDLAVYMEIDSVPPDEPQYRFLWKNTEMRPNNFRIRTIKLRGQLSQGILFPLSVVDDHAFLQEGDDITEALGVTKYEPPLPAGSANVAGQFFDGVPKTDEDRVQNRHDLIEALRGRAYYITVKCDGASMTVAMHDGVPKVASRNYRLTDAPDSAYWNAARNAGLLDMVKSFADIGQDIAVQGELVGPGIQGNKLGLKDHQCYVFNIYDRGEGRYWTLAEMMQFDVIGPDGGRSWPDFPIVPIVTVGHLFNESQESLLAMAEGKYAGTTNEREGIVIRSNDDLGPRISFKAISNRFLLKGGD